MMNFHITVLQHSALCTMHISHCTLSWNDCCTWCLSWPRAPCTAMSLQIINTTNELFFILYTLYSRLYTLYFLLCQLILNTLYVIFYTLSLYFIIHALPCHCNSSALQMNLSKKSDEQLMSRAQSCEILWILPIHSSVFDAGQKQTISMSAQVGLIICSM